MKVVRVTCANCGAHLGNSEQFDTGREVRFVPVRLYAYIAGTTPPGCLVCTSCAPQAVEKFQTTGKCGNFRFGR